MNRNELFNDTTVMDEENEISTLETGPEQYIEEKNHTENVEGIERKVLSIQQKIEAVTKSLNVLKEAYADAGLEEKKTIRSMTVSANWALHRAGQELAETLEALGMVDAD